MPYSAFQPVISFQLAMRWWVHENSAQQKVSGGSGASYWRERWFGKGANNYVYWIRQGAFFLIQTYFSRISPASVTTGVFFRCFSSLHCIQAELRTNSAFVQEIETAFLELLERLSDVSDSVLRRVRSYPLIANLICFSAYVPRFHSQLQFSSNADGETTFCAWIRDLFLNWYH